MSILDMPYDSLTPSQKRQYTITKKRAEAQNAPAADTSRSNVGGSSSAPSQGRQTRTSSLVAAKDIQPRRISAASAAAANARKVSRPIEPLPRPRAPSGSTTTKRAAPSSEGTSGRKRTRLNGSSAATTSVASQKTPQARPLQAVNFAMNMPSARTPAPEQPTGRATSSSHACSGSTPARPVNTNATSRPIQTTLRTLTTSRPTQSPSTRATEDIDVNMSDDEFTSPPRLRRSRQVALDDEDEAPEDAHLELENTTARRERFSAFAETAEEAPEYEHDLNVADPHTETAEFVDEDRVYGDTALDDGTGCPPADHLFDETVQLTPASAQQEHHDSELPEWQDDTNIDNGTASQAVNNVNPQVYPSFTDVVPHRLGKRDPVLNDQSLEVQAMIGSAMFEVVGDSVFVNGFIDCGNPTPYYHSVLIRAATKHGFQPLVQRLRSDIVYMRPLSRWLMQRICKVRSVFKKAANLPALEKAYELPRRDPERATYVDHLTKTSLYIFPSTTRVRPDGTVTREYDRAKPYCHRAIVNVIRDNMFGSSRNDGFANKYADRFVSSLPSRPNELELPMSTVALAAAVVGTSLADLHGSKSAEAVRTETKNRYDNAINTLTQLKTGKPGRFHHLMADLFEEASEGISVVSSRVTTDSVMELIDVDAMPE